MTPFVIAHRGDSAFAPENTLASFEQAVAKGCDWIETDLQLSADGVVVAFHDDSLDRLTRGHGRPQDHDAHLLTGLDVLPGRFANVPGSRTICTLEQILDGPGASVPFYLELKSDGHGRASPHNARLLSTVLDQVPAESPHVFASFDADLAWGAVEAGRMGVLIVQEPRSIPDGLASHLRAVSFRHTALDASLTARWVERGIAVWAWTVDDPGRMRELVGFGVEGLCTNDVALARQTLEPPV